MDLLSDIRKTLRYAKRNGLSDTVYAVAERLKEKAAGSYEYIPPSEEVLRSQRALYGLLADGASAEAVFGAEFTGREMPKLSILVPCYETGTNYLRALIESVLCQTYGNYELILADASASTVVERTVAEYEDPRILYRRLPMNEGISKNTNAAAVYADGDYVVFLDHDDLLTPDALFEAAMGILKTDCEILYTDEDKCDSEGTHYFEPNRKPDFDLDYFLSNNYVCHMMVMKRGLFLALRLRSEYDGSQDFDLLLRAPKTKITHVAKVLYHWRVHNGSTAGDPGQKDYAAEAGKAALEDYFRSRGISAEVEHSRHRGFYRVNYLPDIFTARSDVGIVGGKLVDKRHIIVGGLYDEKGNALYVGLHERESGAMHRADTRQDAYAVDVRCMKIRPELCTLYKEVFGCDYENHVMPKGRDFRPESMEFCRRAAAMGYRTVWEPEMVRVMK